MLVTRNEGGGSVQSLAQLDGLATVTVHVVQWCGHLSIVHFFVFDLNSSFYQCQKRIVEIQSEGVIFRKKFKKYIYLQVQQ